MIERKILIYLLKNVEFSFAFRQIAGHLIERAKFFMFFML